MNKGFIVILFILTFSLIFASCAKVQDIEGDPAISKDSVTGTQITDDVFNDGPDAITEDPSETGAVTVPGILEIETDEPWGDDIVEDEAPGPDGEVTKPNQSVTKPGETKPPVDTDFSDVDTKKVTYEEYNNMAPEQQSAFIKTFPTVSDFMKWYNKAKAEYDRTHGFVDIGDGSIDIGDIFGN